MYSEQERILEEAVTAHFKILLGHYLEGLRKMTKTLKNIGVWAETPTEYLLNKVVALSFKLTCMVVFL
jgi:hypothetical protein